MLSEKTIDILNSLSLEEVMRNNSLAVDHYTSKSVFYCCPFHEERNGSFCVERYPGKGETYAGFHCFVCGKSNGSEGRGAIMLQQKLLAKACQPDDFLSVVNRLAKDFNLIIEGDYKNGFFHRMKKVDPCSEFSIRPKEGPLTKAELRALGCQCIPVFYRDRTDDGLECERAATDADGRTLYKYSFGKDFYQSGCEGENFDSELLKQRFNLVSVASYVTPSRPDADGVLHSYEVSSTDAYPIFAFRYEDKHGWWMRKYEPYFREVADKNGHLGPNHKFTWWYQDDKKRSDLRNYVYGDSDVMEALAAMKEQGPGTPFMGVTTSDEDHPLVNVSRRDSKGNRFDVNVFRRLVICSGPRDAISTYFHSDAHVVFPHSESVQLSPMVIRQLFKISASVYVMYDIDKTGIREMHRLALDYPDLRVLYLPEDLKELSDARTGKQCKDAEEFFNYYPSVIKKREDLKGMSVNRVFADMLTTAKRMRFWDEQFQTKRDEDDNKYKIKKYTLNFDAMSQFLSACGFYKYRDESGTEKYVQVRNNIVDVIDEKRALSVAKEIMKDYLFHHSEFYSEDLSNAISTQKKIGADTLNGIRSIQLNFQSWGEDFEYFFFRDCAVKVTAEGIQTVDYIDLPMQVNRNAIMDYDYHPLHTPLFEIKENPDFKHEEEEHLQRMRSGQLSDAELEEETAKFIAYKRLYRYKLRFTRAMKDMSPCMQYLYDISRMHWRKEQTGMPLNAEETQRQDMNFVSKACAVGYVLSRYRTNAQQQMSVFTDASVLDEAKSSGGTGKSLMFDLLSLVRKVYKIQGKAFKKKENIAKNFQGFEDTVHSICFIDDLRQDISGDEFYNLTDSVVVKSLYKDEYMLPKERTPKFFVTMNNMSFDLSHGSTARRVYLGMVSDYYHAGNYTGTVSDWSPYKKFGRDIILNASADELNETIHMMIQCCQFYLQTKESILPPMEHDGLMRIIYSSIKDSTFIDWANAYFAYEGHFNVPLCIDEIVMNFLDHKGDELTKQNIKKARNEVLQKLKLYCTNMQFIMNPPIVYRADKSCGDLPRWKAWVTEYYRDRPVTERERIRATARCCFFYHLGEDPKYTDAIRQCPEVDTEREEYLMNGGISIDENIE